MLALVPGVSVSSILACLLARVPRPAVLRTTSLARWHLAARSAYSSLRWRYTSPAHLGTAAAALTLAWYSLRPGSPLELPARMSWKVKYVANPDIIELFPYVQRIKRVELAYWPLSPLKHPFALCGASPAFAPVCSELQLYVSLHVYLCLDSHQGDLIPRLLAGAEIRQTL